MPATGYIDSLIQRYPARVKLGASANIGLLAATSASMFIGLAGIRSGDLLSVTAVPTSFGAISSNQGMIAVTSINVGSGVMVGPITGVPYPYDVAIHIERKLTR